MTKISAVNSLREFETNFGILPVPKLDNTQTSYYNSAASLHFSLVAIPVTAADPEMSAVALEAMGYYGQQHLTPAYIEQTLKLKRVNESEDAKMIDFIIDSRSYDLSVMFDWGGLNSFFNKFAGSGKTDFVSQWDSVKDLAQAQMETTLLMFEEK